MGGLDRAPRAPQRAPRVLIIATLNRGKARELVRLLTGLPFTIELLADRPGATLPEETGVTYRENALLKARAAARQTGALSLADDSGLEVDALGGGPGVHSARYGGPGVDDAGRVAKLLEALREVPDARRTARFRAVVVLVPPSGEEQVVEGVAEGFITREPRGAGGFGFDPVFFYPPLGATFGEIPDEQKDRVSHRARAVLALRALLAAGR